MKFWLSLIVGGLLGLLIGIGGAILSTNNLNNTRSEIYSGKMLFVNDSEYSKFKTALLNPNVSVITLNSLNGSEYFVDFEVAMPHGQKFIYGEKQASDTANTFSIYLCLLFGITGTVIGAGIGVQVASWKDWI